MGVFVIGFMCAVLSVAALIVVSYIADCIYIAGVLRVSGIYGPLRAWIPVYSQYLFGRTAGCGWGGILLSLTHLCCAFCVGLMMWLEQDVLFFQLIGMLLAVAFLLKLYLSDRLFFIAVPRKRWLLTVLSFLSLGWLRPAFFLLLRKRLTTAGIWNLHKNMENNL
jgi:hypothetical protein